MSLGARPVPPPDAWASRSAPRPSAETRRSHGRGAGSRLQRGPCLPSARGPHWGCRSDGRGTVPPSRTPRPVHANEDNGELRELRRGSSCTGEPSPQAGRPRHVARPRPVTRPRCRACSRPRPAVIRRFRLGERIPTLHRIRGPSEHQCRRQSETYFRDGPWWVTLMSDT